MATPRSRTPSILGLVNLTWFTFLFLTLLNDLNGITDSDNIHRVFICNLNAEALFQEHNQLNKIKRICIQIIYELCFHGNRIPIKVLFDQSFLEC